MPQMYLIREAAECLGVSVQRVHQLIEEHDIQPIKITRRLFMIAKVDVERLERLRDRRK